MRHNLFTSFVGLLLSASLLVGCGANGGATSSEEPTQAIEANEAVSVDTYSVSSDGATWTPITTTYDKDYQRIVANNQGTANLLIRLGLGDRIVGVAAVYGLAPEDVAEEFDKIPVIAEGYASKEALLSVNPDFVAGRGDLFIDGDYGIGTVEELSDAGITSYITHVGENNASFDSFLADIDNLGKIFHVEDKAEELKEYYTGLTEDLRNDERIAGKTIKMAEVSWLDNGMPVFGSAATETIQNEAFAMIGLDNINGDCVGDQVNLETVIAENPQVIVLFDYIGGPDMDEMIQSLYDNDALADISAIKDKKVYSLDFNAIYGGSGDLYNAMADLADLVYAE